MNTHNIELPPLPVGTTSPMIYGAYYCASNMQDYARAAIKADRQQRGEQQAELLSKFFAALDEATALDSKQSQWSTKPVGTPHDRIVAWAEVHRLRGLLAPQPAAPAQEPTIPEGWQLVPKEATQEMFYTCEHIFDHGNSGESPFEFFDRKYKDILEAAPKFGE